MKHFLVLILVLCTVLIMAYASVRDAHLVRKANQHIKAGQLDKAEQIYNSLPNQSRIAFNKGFLFSKQGELDKSIYYYQIVTQNPKVKAKAKSKANYNIGNSQFRQGDFTAAISAYRQGLLRDPNSYQLKYNLELANNAKKQNQSQNQSCQGKGDMQKDKKEGQGQDPKTEPKQQSGTKSEAQKRAEKALDAFKQQEQNDLIQALPKQKERKVEKDW